MYKIFCNFNFGLQMQKENWWGIKDGLKDLRGEVGKWASEWKERLGDDSHLYVVPGIIQSIHNST